MLPLLSINWDPNPELFNLFGHIPVRYYGLLWVIGIACSYFVVRYQYRDKKSAMTSLNRCSSTVFRYPHRSTPGTLPVLSAGILSSSFLGDDIAYTVPARWRLEMDRLCRSRQSWRYARFDDSPMDVLPQDENALYGRIGYDCRVNSYLRLLHPSCQSDEF